MAFRSQTLAVLMVMLALGVITTWAPRPALADDTCLNTDSETEAEHVTRVNQDLIDYGERVASRNQAESGYEDYTQQYFEAMYVLASIGVFGCGDDGADIYAGPASPVGALRLTYQAMDDPALSAPGAQLSPSGLFRQVLQRLVATDMRALSPEEQIALSNSALLVVEPTMPRSTFQAFPAYLDRAGQGYLSALVHGETTGTYPQYLDDNGYADVFD